MTAITLIGHHVADPIQTVTLGQVVHMRWTEEFSVCLFPDGSSVPALAMINDEGQRATARALGYERQRSLEDAVCAMCWEHEVLHSLLARARGEPCSQVLWDVAHSTELDATLKAEHAQEEADVLCLQRFLNDSRNAAEVVKVLHGYGPWVFRTEANAILGRTRWQLLPYTSNSGKLLFACGDCGRISPTPDKVCSVLGQGEIKCEG